MKSVLNNMFLLSKLWYQLQAPNISLDVKHAKTNIRCDVRCSR